MNETAIKTLFLDIGGVLLTNGWGHLSRTKAAKEFHLDNNEFERRHRQTFDTYESGKMTLSSYLKFTVFYESRSFSEKDFIQFIKGESVALSGAIDFFKSLKKKYQLKVIAVSNEGREINAFRVSTFKLNELFDAYVSSSFVHLRKPDMDIFRLALDIAQTAPEHCIYIDDRLMFVEIAKSLGMNGLHYQGLDGINDELEIFGL